MTTTNSDCRRLILLEFNELCPDLIDKFIAEGILPNFKRLREAADTFVTHTNEAILEPWIQWVTVHTGVPLAEHGIVDLDEANKLRHTTFWEERADQNVLLISPMNVNFKHTRGSVFLPDPWAASQAPSEEISALHAFIRFAVGNHARSDSLQSTSTFAALRFLLTHGLSGDSLAATVKQLWDERFSSGKPKWRRATILDRLLWDVFAHFWRSSQKPRIGVFFSNATAHYQHKYWWHYDPTAFSNKPDQTDIQHYGNAIRFGYQAHDRLIGKAMELSGDDTVLALCSALSQQPMRDYEDRGGKAMFIPKDYRALLQLLGAPSGRTEPLMAEECWLHYPTSSDAREAFARLSAARTNKGAAVLKTRSLGERSFIVGCNLFVSEVDDDTLILGSNGTTARFLDHFLRMETVTSAKHHPDGLLWLKRPHVKGERRAERLPLTLVRKKLEQALDSHLSQ